MQLLGHVRLLVLARRRSHEISHLRDFVDLFSMPKLSSALAQLQGPAFGKPPPQFLRVNRVLGILQGTAAMPSEAPAARCPGPASGGAISALEP